MNIRSLRIGVLDYLQCGPARSAGESLHEVMDLARLLDSLGYERFWMSEHHNAGIATACPEVMTATVLAQTRRIRVGPAGILLRFYSPFKVADTFRTLEALYPGRVDLGVGRGGTDPVTSTALLDGAPQTSTIYDRKVVELASWLRGGPGGGHPMGKARLVPESVPAPPQLWVLGGGRGSVPLAARLGAAFSFARFLPTKEDSVAVLDEYRRAFVPREDVAGPLCNVAVAGICAPTRRRARELLEAHENSFIRPEIVGTPEECRDQLLELAERHETAHVSFAHVAADVADRYEGYRLLAEALSLKARA